MWPWVCLTPGEIKIKPPKPTVILPDHSRRYAVMRWPKNKEQRSSLCRNLPLPHETISSYNIVSTSLTVATPSMLEAANTNWKLPFVPEHLRYVDNSIVMPTQLPNSTITAAAENRWWVLMEKTFKITQVADQLVLFTHTGISVVVNLTCVLSTSSRSCMMLLWCQGLANGRFRLTANGEKPETGG